MHLLAFQSAGSGKSLGVPFDILRSKEGLIVPCSKSSDRSNDGSVRYRKLDRLGEHKADSDI